MAESSLVIRWCGFQMASENQTNGTVFEWQNGIQIVQKQDSNLNGIRIPALCFRYAVEGI